MFGRSLKPLQAISWSALWYNVAISAWIEELVKRLLNTLSTDIMI